MKLYSTTTSERATKNQGGNKFIDIELTAGRDRTVMIQISLQHEETETEDIYKLWNGDILVDTLRETKGKRQKGECDHKGEYVYNTVYGQQCRKCSN